MKEFKDQAPNLENPNGNHNEEVNYPTIANMNPKSYGKIESKLNHTYVYAEGPFSHSTNPADKRYKKKDLSIKR